MRYSFKAIVLGGALAAAVSAGCNRKTDESQATPPPTDTAARQTQGKGLGYPEPRFPSYLKPPSSIEEVMPYVRPLVRARRGLQGAGLGIIEKGETALFVVSTDAEDMIVNAVVKGMEERGVKVVVKRDYEIAGFRRKRRSPIARRAHVYLRAGIHGGRQLGGRQLPEARQRQGVVEGAPPGSARQALPREPGDVPRSRRIYEKMRGENIGAVDPRVPG